MENYGDRKRKGEVRERRSGSQSSRREASHWETTTTSTSIKLFGKTIEVPSTEHAEVSTKAQSSTPVEGSDEQAELQKIKKYREIFLLIM